MLLEEPDYTAEARREFKPALTSVLLQCSDQLFIYVFIFPKIKSVSTLCCFVWFAG